MAMDDAIIEVAEQDDENDHSACFTLAWDATRDCDGDGWKGCNECSRRTAVGLIAAAARNKAR
jgi:hypothetical protein